MTAEFLGMDADCAGLGGRDPLTRHLEAARDRLERQGAASAAAGALDDHRPLRVAEPIESADQFLDRFAVLDLGTGDSRGSMEEAIDHSSASPSCRLRRGRRKAQGLVD